MKWVRVLVHGLLLANLVGCAAVDDPVQRAVDEGFPASHIVELDDNTAVATRVHGSTFEVVFVYPDAAGELQSTISRGDFVPGTNSFGFSTGSGLGLTWNTFLYGSAAPGVTRVTSTVPDGRGGEVVDGLWVIASPSEGYVVGNPSVTFLDDQGGVVEQQ